MSTFTISGKFKLDGIIFNVKTDSLTNNELPLIYLNTSMILSWIICSDRYISDFVQFLFVLVGISYYVYHVIFILILNQLSFSLFRKETGDMRLELSVPIILYIISNDLDESCTYFTSGQTHQKCFQDRHTIHYDAHKFSSFWRTSEHHCKKYATVVCAMLTQTLHTLLRHTRSFDFSRTANDICQIVVMWFVSIFLKKLEIHI